MSKNLIRNRWLGLLIVLAGAVPLSAADQTATFSPVTPWSGHYQLQLTRLDMGGAAVPTMHSFASGTVQGEWVILGGRTNGMHSFVGNTFPPSAQNSTVWVINPLTRQTWSRSLTDVSSGLTESQIVDLSTTNSQSFQEGNTLFYAGGYVFDSVANRYETRNRLSAIDLSDLRDWVKGTTPTLATGAIVQTTGENLPGIVTDTGYFAVSGGEMSRNPESGQIQLVFGHDFQGAYTPGRNGQYTSQVRSFEVDYDRAAGTLGYSNLARTPNPGDESQFRRRDLNIVPGMRRDPVSGALESDLIALGGVFFNGEGVWTVPVEIDAQGVPRQVDPLNPNNFRQAMNQYTAANLTLYSESSDDLTAFLFGGISVNTYDPTTGNVLYDAKAPYISQITAITRDSDGDYRQEYVGEMPLMYGPLGRRLLMGANAKFFADPTLPRYANDVINLDAITDKRILGYIYGGIASNQPNFGQTVASNEIFVVTLSIPEPGTLMLLGVGGLGLVIARFRAGSRRPSHSRHRA